MRHLGDCRRVRHLERLRAGRLDQHGARVRPEQFCDTCADQRIVVGGLDAEALQHAVAEAPGRLIRAVADQQVVAPAQHREQCGGNRCKPGRQQRDARAVGALERRDRVGQRLGGRRAFAPVLEFAAIVEDVICGRVKQVEPRTAGVLMNPCAWRGSRPSVTRWVSGI
jgi:hypothetical protein